MLTFGSLFTGIGGIDLGLERAVMVCKWQVEIDPFATKVLEKHWPDVARFRDVRECHGAGFCDVADAESAGEAATQQSGQLRGVEQSCTHCLSPVDLICGGFPCQDVSLAGKRAGLQGKRSTLWSEFARLIRELRPRWVLAENVPGLYSASDGRFFGRVLRDLAESGYSAEWDSLPAAAFGAPHRRYRVFIVAHAQYNGRDEAKVSEGIGTRDGAPPWQSRAQQPARPSGSQGGTESVAHAQVGQDNERERRDLAEEATSWQGGNAPADAGSEDVAHAEGEQSYISELFQGAEAIAQMQFGRLGSNADWWAVESRLGGTTDGFPNWLDRHIGRGMSNAESKRAVQTLQELWSNDVSQALWRKARGLDRISQAEVLFSFVRQYQESPDKARVFLESAEAPEGEMRSVRGGETATGTPHRPGHQEQPPDEHSDAMQMVSRLLAFDSTPQWMVDSWEDGIPRVANGIPSRVDRLRCLGNAVVPQVAEWIGRRILATSEGTGA